LNAPLANGYIHKKMRRLFEETKELSPIRLNGGGVGGVENQESFISECEIAELPVA